MPQTNSMQSNKVPPCYVTRQARGKQIIRNCPMPGPKQKCKYHQNGSRISAISTLSPAIKNSTSWTATLSVCPLARIGFWFRIPHCFFFVSGLSNQTRFWRFPRREPELSRVRTDITADIDFSARCPPRKEPANKPLQITRLILSLTILFLFNSIFTHLLAS